MGILDVARELDNRVLGRVGEPSPALSLRAQCVISVVLLLLGLDLAVGWVVAVVVSPVLAVPAALSYRKACASPWGRRISDFIEPKTGFFELSPAWKLTALGSYVVAPRGNELSQGLSWLPAMGLLGLALVLIRMYKYPPTDPEV